MKMIALVIMLFSFFGLAVHVVVCDAAADSS